MIISITGTPGTGKSSVSRILAKKLGANLIDIRGLIEKKKIPYGWDRKRNTRIVATLDLKKAVEKRISRNKVNIVEGHLSHFLRSDFTFVLRCNPAELQERLRKRGWSPGKIHENMVTEILDAITIEAMDGGKSKNIYEIDTTAKKPEKIADAIARMLKYSSLKRYHGMLKRYAPGRIDWSEKHKGMLARQFQCR